MDDYICALRKKILLQGRLFIFERHLCFHSSLFGYQKAKVIPLDAVIEIDKKKNVGFPNSIQITWDASPQGESIKKEFFTSFLSREEAYKLIIGLWAQCSDRGREHATTIGLGATEDEENASRSMSRRWSKWVRVGAQADAEQDTTSRVEGDPSMGGGDGETPTHAGANGSGPFAWNQDSLLSSPLAEGSGDVDAFVGLSEVEGGGPIVTRSSAETAGAVPEFEEVFSCTDAKAVREYFDGAREASPPMPSDMQRVMKCTLPTSSRGFFVAFLCPNSSFFEDFHRSQGHHSIQISPWQKHYKVGPVRDLRFVTPLKGWRLGPPQALCHQTQRLKAYAGQHLVFETSQVMSDIPYGDHFRVDQRWDITPSSSTPGACDLEVHIAVPFTKSTMWRKFIEKSVTSSTLEAFQMFKELAERQLENCASHPPPAMKEGATSASLSPPLRSAPGSRSDTPSSVVPHGPMHRRTPSRPASPEEVLPGTNEEWERLLSQVEPQFRGGLRALRRTQVHAAGGPAAVGSTAPRHRRRGSRARSIDWQGINEIPASPRTTLSKVPEGGAVSGVGGQGRIEESHNNSSNSSFLSRRWPTLILCLVGVVIICLQAALVGLHLRAARSNASGLMLSAAYSSGDADGRAAREAMLVELSALTSQAEGLQAEAEGWKSRIDDVSSRAAKLKSHAKRMLGSLEHRNTRNPINERKT